MAGREKIVVDASVAYKWYIEEEWSGEARGIVMDYGRGWVDIAAPALISFEVLNALRYAPGTGLIQLLKATESMEKLHLDLYMLRGELSERTMENALKYGLTAYDSAYLSLGELLEAPAYTADEKILRKVDDKTLTHISNYRKQVKE
jgi:predicted nucleic acid-binding protein